MITKCETVANAVTKTRIDHLCTKMSVATTLVNLKLLRITFCWYRGTTKAVNRRHGRYCAVWSLNGIDNGFLCMLSSGPAEVLSLYLWFVFVCTGWHGATSYCDCLHNESATEWDTRVQYWLLFYDLHRQLFCT